MKEILALYDDKDRRKFSEHTISSELLKLLPDDNNEAMNFELLSEIMAFSFSESNSSEHNQWDTYYGPMHTWLNDDGTVTESPSITRVTPEMIGYWLLRSSETTNPILTARYTGLVWDFQRKISGSSPSYEVGIRYVNALLDIAEGQYYEYEHAIYISLERALQISSSLNSAGLIERCKNILWSFEKSVAQDNQPGLWGYSFDLLIGNKKVNLSEEEEQSIIGELENKLQRLIKPNNENANTPDPWAAEIAAERLAMYYRKKSRDEDIRRVIMSVEEAYVNTLTDKIVPSQFHSWLERLYELYKKFNLIEESERILIKMRELGPDVASDMKTLSHEITVSTDEIEAFSNAMLEGTIEEFLLRFTIRYIPIKDEVKEKVLELSKQAPMQYLITHKIQDNRGRVIATIPPLEEDIEGHIIRQISQSLHIYSIFIREILKRAVTIHSLSISNIIEFISKSPVIQRERVPIIEKGLKAYFDNDYLTSIHLLIPQIEESIRNIVEFTGHNVLKQSRGGGFHLKTFDELLRETVTVECLGVDCIYYFRILFTDQRGWNLRNDICHGVAPPELFNPQTADRVLHALLCLGLIRKGN